MLKKIKDIINRKTANYAVSREETGKNSGNGGFWDRLLDVIYKNGGGR